ncbi:MAG: hypothetical protein WCF44_19670 [Candidatus Methylophosphatis roskildensis]|nr:hypothetical protein [Sterolibacteriaceae bacterium]
MLTAPTYAKWCDRKLWTVRESICLMLAIEPGTARGKDEHDIGGFDPLSEAIEQYAELADEAMKSGTLKPFSARDLAHPPLDRRVEPSAFLDWARSWGVAIPDELVPVLGREPMRAPAQPTTVLELIGRGYRGADHIEEAHEQVLGAALAAVKAYPERCGDATGIRRTIDDNASLLWPDTRCAPLTAIEIERLIDRWLDRLG